MTVTMTETTRPQRLQTLIDALLSGDYPQAREALRTDEGFCCLGVGCDVYRLATGEGRWERLGSDNDGSQDWYFVGADGREATGTLPPEVADWYFGDPNEVDPTVAIPGLGRFGRLHLSTLNDDGVPFAVIAGYVRDQLLPAATP